MLNRINFLLFNCIQENLGHLRDLLASAQTVVVHRALDIAALDSTALIGSVALTSDLERSIPLLLKQ